jgi:hypothetical protein
VRGRREADQEHAGVRIAEARQRTRPVPLSPVAARRNGRDGLAVRDQSRASPAPHDPAREILEGAGARSRLVLSPGLADNHAGMIATRGDP